MGYERPEIHIEEVMSTPLETIEKDATLAEAAAQMRTKNIKALVIPMPSPSIITSTDIVDAAADAKDPKTTTVENIMTEVTKTVSPNNLLEEAAGVMARSKINHLPVVRDGECVGMVSATDITRERA